MKNFNQSLVPDIKFTPYAWQKLLYFMYIGDTEVSGWGITEEDDSLIVDFRLVKQKCTSCETDMEKDGLADYLNKMVDEGYNPVQCMRHWIHFHPGSSTTPSGTDEDTFSDLLANQPWVTMIIVGQDQSTYCRLGVNQGPGAIVELTAGVDWRQPIEYAVDFDELNKEYKENVTIRTLNTANFYKEPASSPYADKFRQNYESINWNPDDELASRWGHGYNDYKDCDNLDSELDESDLNHCFQEFLDKDDLAEKSLHEMDDKEFERFCKKDN